MTELSYYVIVHATTIPRLIISGECGLVALVVGVILAALLISVMGLLIYMIRTRSPGGRPPSPTKVHPADDQQVPPSKSTLGTKEAASPVYKRSRTISVDRERPSSPRSPSPSFKYV